MLGLGHEVVEHHIMDKHHIIDSNIALIWDGRSVSSWSGPMEHVSSILTGGWSFRFEYPPWRLSNLFRMF